MLDGLEQLSRERDDLGRAEILSTASLRLREGRFTLVVMGEFKRGKSTLINALLGSDVMPVGVTPLTSAAVTIEHGEEGAFVRFDDGREEAVALGDLEHYATEPGNPGNALGVQRVKIRHPAELLRQGVILVDTPGVGSIYRHNTEAVYRYLPEADAVIFVLGVDPPASEAELALLRDVNQHVARVFLLLNKSDQLSLPELETVLAFVRGALSSDGGVNDPVVVPVSARERDLGFRRFREELELFLAHGRGAFLLERAEERAKSAIDQIRLEIDLTERSLDLSVDELHRKRDLLEQRLEQVRQRRWEAEHHLEADFKALIANHLDPAFDGLAREGSQQVRTTIERALSGGHATAANLDAVIKKEIRTLAAEWMRRLETRLGDRIGELGGHYAAEANSLASQVQELTAEVFGVSPEHFYVPARLEPQSRFSFRLEDQLMGVELLALGLRQLAPGRFGRWLVKRDALQRADELVDRHRGRVRYDLVERLKEQEKLLHKHLGDAVDAVESGILGSLRQAATLHHQGLESVVRERQRLQSHRKILGKLEQTLTESSSA